MADDFVHDRISELTEERAQIADEIQTLAMADDFDPESAEWKHLQTRGERVDSRLAALRVAKENRAKADHGRDMLFRAPAASGISTRDIGEQILTSESWRAYVRNGMGGRAHLMSLDMQRRAVITSAFMPGEKPRIYADAIQPPTPLLDVLANVQVSNSSVEVIDRVEGPEAGIVAEGAPKPEATLTSNLRTVTLDTIAHWVQVTRRAVTDENQLRDTINNELIAGVYKRAETGAAGIIAAATYATAGGANMAEAVRSAAAMVQTKGFTPNAVLINPTDAAEMDFVLWGLTNSVTQTNSLFGLRIVAVPSLAAGSAFVGDFRAGARFLYKGNAQLYVSDSDVVGTGSTAVSGFRSNVLTYLAEMEAVTVIVQGAAIVEATPTGTTTRATAAPTGQGSQRGVTVGGSSSRDKA